MTKGWIFGANKAPVDRRRGVDYTDSYRMQFDMSIGSIVIILLCLIISITIHEMMHAFVALKLGDTTAHEAGRITFNPLHHVDFFSTILLPIITLIAFQVPLLAAKPVPFNPDRVKFEEYGAALVALAGPLSNLLMAAIAGVLLAMVPAGLLQTILITFVAINVGLFVFNMIPIPPLDGSRLLYAFAPESIRGFMASLELYGIFIVFGLALLVPGFTVFISNLNQIVLRIVL